MLGQDRLEPIFHATLARLGCTVELGTELVSFTQADDHVEAKLRVKGMNPGSEGVEEIASFDYMVGTDGARGVVRKQLGLPFAGETRTVENFVVGDIKIKGLSPKARIPHLTYPTYLSFPQLSSGTCGEINHPRCMSFSYIFPMNSFLSLL